MLKKARHWRQGVDFERQRLRWRRKRQLWKCGSWIGSSGSNTEKINLNHYKSQAQKEP